jgi:hypothetical protein
MALAQRAQGLPLFADNGSKNLIDHIVESRREASRRITDRVQAIRRRLGRTPRAGDLPGSLRRAARALASAVVADSVALASRTSPEESLDRQLSMQPTHLIAPEDFAVTCLVALGLERFMIGWGGEDFRSRNRRSLQLHARAVADARCRDLNVYAVLSAVDYDTARAAGELAARAGAEHVAIGFASALKDSGAVESFAMGRKTVRLAAPAPRRYVRVAQIVRGIADGYRRLGAPLRSFHGLGLGAVTLFPVIAAAFEPGTDLTVDATSPILDAVRDRVLYDHEQDANRLPILSIVNRIVRSQDWPFLCPFCRSFRKEFGHSARAARRWFEQQRLPAVDQESLDSAEALADAIPLFSGSNAHTRRKAELTHIAHNHFVLDQVAGGFLHTPDRPARALAKLDELAGRESMITARGVRAARQVLTHPLDE